MKFRAIAVLAAAFLLVSAAWTSVPAAEEVKPDKDGWIPLFNGKDLTGWHKRNLDRPHFWLVENGKLINRLPAQDPHGNDLVSDVPLMDHELFVRFNTKKDGNSGVYLQGRYEVQVSDSFGQKPGMGSCGAIYGKIVPKENASKPVGEDQFFHIKFRSARLGDDGKVAKKARITVIHNEKTIIEDAEIDGVTGSAVDNKEGTPAGLMLQGDHTDMTYWDVQFRPLKADAK